MHAQIHEPPAPFSLRGRLCSARTLATLSANARFNSPSSNVAPGRGTTAAHTFSPYVASSTPNATASATPGSASRAESSSIGEIFSPPRLMSCVRARTWGEGGGASYQPVWNGRGSGGKTDLFQTTGKDQVSLGRQVAFIARAEPPAAVPAGPESLPIGFFIIDVAEHDVAPADAHFPARPPRELASVLGRANGQFHPLRFPDRARVARAVVREGRAAHGVRGFAHGVRLEHGRLECFLQSGEDGRAEAAAA